MLCKYQFGFKANHSTSLALIEVTDNICEQLDAGSTVCGVYLDLQKAFDSVSHDVLLNNLNIYGIRGIVYDWFKSYLCDRYQYILAWEELTQIFIVTDLEYRKDQF
jgi:hypothetical protein